MVGGFTVVSISVEYMRLVSLCLRDSVSPSCCFVVL